jgi:hypothetical protein
VSDRERALAEAWLDDEMLRDDLDDDTWQPIQDWLLRTARRVASLTTGLDDTSAQPLLDQARATARAIVLTLADILRPEVSRDRVGGRIEALHEQVGWPVVEPDRTPRVHAALRSATDGLSRGQADRPAVARLLTAALDTGLPARPSHDL